MTIKNIKPPKGNFICAYCGKVLEKRDVHRDHIPSKALFPKGYPIKNPITVPACLECNRGFSKDEEYFRAFAVNVSIDRSPTASDLFDTSIARSIRARPGLGIKIFNKMQLVNLKSKEGISLGKRTVLHISDEDWERYFRVIDKYVRGLFYFYTSKRLEDFGFIVNTNYLDPKTPIESELIKTVNINKNNERVFISGHSFVPKTNQAVFLFAFYENITFISFVARKEDYEKFRNVKSN